MNPGTVFVLRYNWPVFTPPRHARLLSLTQIRDILSTTVLEFIHAEIFYPHVVSHPRYIITYSSSRDICLWQMWGVTAPAGIPPMAGKQRRRNQSPKISKANLALISQPIFMSDKFLKIYWKTHVFLFCFSYVNSKYSNEIAVSNSKCATNIYICQLSDYLFCSFLLVSESNRASNILLKRFWNFASNELLHAS